MCHCFWWIFWIQFLTDLLSYSFQRAFCAFCQDRIWGLGRQGFKCIQCKLLVHKKCHKLVSKSCSNEAVDITASEETNGDNTPTTRKYCHYKHVSLSSVLILIFGLLLLLRISFCWNEFFYFNTPFHYFLYK